MDTVTIPTTGTYTILVDLQGPATGEVTSTLYDVPADVNNDRVRRPEDGHDDGFRPECMSLDLHRNRRPEIVGLVWQAAAVRRGSRS